jgi:hypothetical protein
MRQAGYISRTLEKRKAYRNLVMKLEGKRPLGRTRRTWEDDGELGLRGIEREITD